MNNRRHFLTRTLAQTTLASLGIHSAAQLGFASPGRSPAASTRTKSPYRFIFIHKGNGLFPKTLVPPNLGKQDQQAEKRKEPFEADLAKLELPDWMRSLDKHKSELTLLQGLSGKMCTTGHHTWQSSLGAYKANERLSSIKWATVDFELAKLFPSPFEHIELACFPSGGGNARGNINGIEKGFSARGPQQPNYAFGSPKIAMQELFKSVSTNKQDQVQYELERKVLKFAARNQSAIAEPLKGLERSKVQNYADSLHDIRKRNRRVDQMADSIAANLPQLESKYLADELTTVDRQSAFTEILLSTLIAGMTNVVAFTIDELGTPYTGLPKIENESVNLHDVGHGKPVGKLKAEEVRDSLRQHHMQLIDRMVTRLKSVPEGDGSLFDYTILFYFPDNGETHHSHGTEWPFVILAGDQVKLDIAGRYIRLPYYGKPGHKTLGNWYTTLLNAYGNPVEHYGSLDTGLDRFSIRQTGPIQHFLRSGQSITG